MVRELFEMARSKKACIIFFDEIDAVGGEKNFRGMLRLQEKKSYYLEAIKCFEVFTL
jgi:26S proteasome regulatory subunit T1